ncbi:MAG TPA: polyphosphate polymerase domain-containing protein [Gemmataceae bacterium]|nr:polyphosphate polymerase domain-containing protein [Gemmataceae bacterium]
MKQDNPGTAAGVAAVPSGSSESLKVTPSCNGVAEAVSPSLGVTDGVPAFELKFLLDPARAERVLTWARCHLAPDPHADPALGGAYRVHSLYLDTAGLDVYHQADSYRRRKYRLRRYGAEPWLFLERKSRWGDRVAKRRTRVDETEVGRLRAELSSASWPADWFHQGLVARRLGPTCRVSYDRLAFIGTTATGRVRLTLDRDVRCAPADGWSVTEIPDGMSLLTGESILELKFLASLPGLFKDLILEAGLNPRSASKYRMGVRAWGMDGSPGR